MKNACEWIIIARLDGMSDMGFMLTQFWGGKGWAIVDSKESKRFPTKKDAEAAAVGIVMSENLHGWTVSAMLAKDAPASESVEIREA